MRRLLLLRHAKAEPVGSGPSDFDRGLIERGGAAATLIGRYMSLNRIAPDAVLSSPSKRTRQTVERIEAELGAKLDVVLLSALYNAPAAALLDQIREHGGEAKTLLVVGHNTGVEEALALLVRPSADSLAVPASYPTGTLAILALEDGEWSGLERRSGRLTAFVRPRDLEGKPSAKS